MLQEVDLSAGALDQLLGVLDTAHEAFVSIDGGGRVVAWNRVAEETFGWSRAEAVGRSMAELVIPERFRPAHRTGLDRLAAGGEGRIIGKRVELWALHRAGHEFPIEMTLSAISVAGEPRFNAFLHDISERRAAEAQTRRLAAIVEASDDAIVSGTPDGTIETWNAGAERLYGFRASEMVGRSIAELRPDTDDDELMDEVRRRVHAGESLRDVRTRERRKDGSLVDVSISVSPLRGAAGEVEGIVSITRDITDRAGLREARERFERAFEHAPNGMALVDLDGRFMSVNRALCEIVRRSPEELCRMTFRELTHPEDVAEDDRRRAEILAGRSDAYQREKRYLLPDGTVVWIGLSVTFVRGDDGAPLYAIAQTQDITASRSAEQHLRQYTEHLASLAGQDPVRGLLHGAAPAQAASAARVQHILELAREQLGMEVAFLSEFAGDALVFRAIAGAGESFALRPDDSMPLAGTYCRGMVDGAIPPIVADIRSAPLTRDMPITRETGIGAYAGVPLVLADGSLFGTLCCIDHERRDGLGQRELGLLRFLAELVSEVIATDARREDDRRAETEVVGVHALLAALDARDHYTGEHSNAVVGLAVDVAGRLGLSETEIAEVEQVAVLHDIGKVGIPDAILQKQGPLDDVEWELMRHHPAIGERIIAGIASLAHLAPAIRAEHERWDGGGYPDGLAGDAIPLASRIGLACDAYHAMTSDRPYRPRLEELRAREELRGCAGSQFDPAVVEALLSALAERDRATPAAQEGAADRGPAQP